MFVFGCSDREADGSEGSKKPCECCRGLCFWNSKGGASGEPRLGSCGMNGRGALLLFAVARFGVFGLYGDRFFATENAATLEDTDVSLADEPGRWACFSSARSGEALAGGTCERCAG